MTLVRCEPPQGVALGPGSCEAQLAGQNLNSTATEDTLPRFKRRGSDRLDSQRGSGAHSFKEDPAVKKPGQINFLTTM